MITHIQITVKVSSDDSFIKRISNWDPFDYWNRCITEGTSRDRFLNPDEFKTFHPYIQDGTMKTESHEGSIHDHKVVISIAKSGTIPFNYLITYLIEGNLFINYGKTHNDIIEALIMYHGYMAVKVETI